MINVGKTAYLSGKWICVILMLLGILGCKKTPKISANEASIASQDLTITTLAYGYEGDKLIFAVFLIKLPSASYHSGGLDLRIESLPSGKNIWDTCKIFANGRSINLKTHGGLYQIKNGVLISSQTFIPCSKSDLELYIKSEREKYSLDGFIRFLNKTASAK